MVSLRRSIDLAFTVLAGPSVLLLVYLYSYPVFHLCSFPHPDLTPFEAFKDTAAGRHPPYSPFIRFLALGDPQLEGDTSIPFELDPPFPALRLLWRLAPSIIGGDNPKAPVFGEARQAFFDFLTDDLPYYLRHHIPRNFKALRKTLDLFGNDLYLAHITRSISWWTTPHLTAVLGDLLGSQWIDNDEFERRASRFWNQLLPKGRRIPDGARSGWKAVVSDHADFGDWTKTVFTLPGNHDVGYAGDITQPLLDRYEKAFGPSNYDVSFEFPKAAYGTEVGADPSLHIISLNSMALDGPVLNTSIQQSIYSYLNSVIDRSPSVPSQSTFTVLMTHIPLHREAGICVDGPYTTYHDSENGGGIKEQNHLSYHSSRQILEGVFGMSSDTNRTLGDGGRGRRGLILTGHDHEGCDTIHYLDPSVQGGELQSWRATRYNAELVQRLDQSGTPFVREITVRSMMGGFAGNAGLVSLWFDDAVEEWKSAYSTCSLGVQHWWWAIHIVALAEVGLGLAGVIVRIVEHRIKGKRFKRVRFMKGTKRASIEDLKAQGGGSPRARFGGFLAGRGKGKRKVIQPRKAGGK